MKGKHTQGECKVNKQPYSTTVVSDVSKCCNAKTYYCGSVTYCEKCKHITTLKNI